MTSFIKNAIFITSILATLTTFAADPHWTYDEEWDNLSNAIAPTKATDLPYAECGLGQKQSPVDLGSTKTVTSTNALKPVYKSEALTVVNNNGHSIKVNVPATTKSVLSVGSEQYTLLQYHIHAPSEHVIGGKTYVAEIHFVHGTPDGKLAVVGVLVDAPAIQQKPQNLLNVAPKNTTDAPALTANPAKLLPSTSKFYLYSGSLTTQGKRI